MNRRAKIADWLSGGELTKIKARYEASLWNNSRSYLPGNLQSAREDISALPRQEIMRRVRYFEKNASVQLKALRCLDVNVVGAGITPTPLAADPKWRKLALAWWNEWVPYADKTEQSDYYKLQSIAYRAEIIDGDSYLDLTLNAANRPAIDIIEAHRVGNGNVDIRDIERLGFKVVDGIIIDSFRRPSAYIVADDFSGADVQMIPVSRMVKLFNRKRAGQYRGISAFHAAVLDLHDKDDLQKYEMRAAKDGSAKANIFETPAGGVTVESDVGASLNTAQGTDPTQRLAYYRQAIAGETLVLQPGEKMTQFESKRPSAAMSGFWDKLDRKIAQAIGISYAALVDYEGNWGGATLRAVVQSDARVYELETNDQACASQRVWEYAIGWAIQHGELPANADRNKVRWHPPRRATVDVGNDSKAMIEEVKGAFRTYRDTHGEKGEDWEEQFEQRAIEEAKIDELAKKYGVSPARIASFAQERLAGIAPDAEEPAGGDPAKGGGKGNEE